MSASRWHPSPGLALACALSKDALCQAAKRPRSGFHRRQRAGNTATQSHVIIEPAIAATPTVN